MNMIQTVFNMKAHLPLKFVSRMVMLAVVTFWWTTPLYGVFYYHRKKTGTSVVLYIHSIIVCFVVVKLSVVKPKLVAVDKNK